MRENQSSSANRTTAPLVVKIGGSLQCAVQKLAPVLRSSERPLLIVPGGGIFADAVRETHSADDAAHWMAIAAMEQYGWLISSYGLATTEHLVRPESTRVFLPYTCLRERDPLPHTWDITSDSISAWVAYALGLSLLVLKPVDGIRLEGVVQDSITAPVHCNEVDAYFLPFVLSRKIPTTIVNGLCTERVEQFLKGDPVRGTRIGTTF